MTAHQHDGDDPCPACAQPWQQAGSVSELCELTARFVEGGVRAHPRYGAPTVDDETAGLVDALAAINRAGLLTDQSQPGVDADGHQQRAWIAGLAPEAVVDALLAGCLDGDLMVLALPPGTTEGARVCVSRDGAKECTWGGAFGPPWERYWNGSETLLRDLAQLWCVEVIDPVWGRNTLLWPTVRAALTARPVRQYFLL